MTADAPRVKLVFELHQDEDGYPPVGYEGVWAEPLADGNFRIDNIPFYSYEAALDDVVSATEQDGRLLFQSLVRPSGNSLLRVIARVPETVPEICAHLTKLGCDWESTGSLIAVHVPMELDYSPVIEYLVRGMNEDRWGVEEAVLCHKIDAASPLGRGAASR
jgi:hypothetical protein